MLSVLTELFVPQHFDVTIATSLAMLLPNLKRNYDVVLLDLSLPDADGKAVLAEIHKHPHLANVPVVCVTSSDDQQTIADMFAAGALDYVIKPFHHFVLLSKVRTFIDLKRKTEHLEALSIRDPLTGLYNRRELKEQLHKEWRRCMRTQTEMTVMMIDVDNFKSINDNLGHSTGDTCLQQTAKAISAGVKRPGDAAFRYGGDEFALILPNTNIHAASIIAEQIRNDAIASCKELTQGTFTLTIGIASAMPSETDSPLRLMESADAVLMDAKRQNKKNAVYIA